MSTVTIPLSNLTATEKLGRILGETAVPGQVICLDGDLGSGKTTLTQAIARGLGVPDEQYVTSPTFTIMHAYEGRMAMYHMDFYRLLHGTEVFDLGFDEYFYLDGLTVIEWSSKALDMLPEERLSLEILNIDENARQVVMHATVAYEALLANILGIFGKTESACKSPDKAVER